MRFSVPSNRLLIACLALVGLLMPAWAQAQALRLGLVPNVSARVIFANYQPMRAFLEADLGQAIEMETAPDFRSFHQRTVAQQYDVIVTAANLARLAQVDHGWQPVAQYEPAIPGVLVRAKSTPVDGLAAIKGKKLALANPQSLVALRAFAWLEEKGLKQGQDYTISAVRNDDSLGAALRAADTPYAVMSLGEFRAIPERTRVELEIETEFATVPGFVVLASPKSQAAQVAKLSAALQRFVQSEQGKTFFSLAGVRNIRPSQPRELEGLDMYLPQTRTGLAP
jgi:phosphonate transport system substrate-binding protein